MPESRNDETPNEKIRRNLVRTVIKQPLLDQITSGQATKQPIPIIVELNDEYFLGKSAAILAIAARFTSSPVFPIGSGAGPYYKTSATAKQILDAVEGDFEAAAKAQTSKDDPMVRYLAIRRIWFDHPVNALIDKSVSTVKADAVHRSFEATGKGIVWAVIDSGVDKNHQHFKTAKTLDINAPLEHCDFTSPAGTAQTSLNDVLGHGTHVAGIIAGRFSGTGAIAKRTIADSAGNVDTFDEPISAIVGMAPECRLVSMKVLDDQGLGGISNILAALDKVMAINDGGRTPRIHGVNLSVGYEFDPSWFACGQSPVCAEVNRLVRSGVVVVVAAGNTGYGTLSANARATGAGLMMTINDPGNAEFAITVGSTHRDSPHTYGVSYFSSKGPTGDGRIKPDLVAPGERILSCRSSDSDGGGSNIYAEDTGTSMAAPHVSGVIAGFLSIRQEYIGNPEKVKELFLSTATDLGRQPHFQGHGLVDAMRAIQAV